MHRNHLSITSLYLLRIINLLCSRKLEGCLVLTNWANWTSQILSALMSWGISRRLTSCMFFRAAVVLQFNVPSCHSFPLLLHPPPMSHDARPYEQTKMCNDYQTQKYVCCYLHAPKVVDQGVALVAEDVGFKLTGEIAQISYKRLPKPEPS